MSIDISEKEVRKFKAILDYLKRLADDGVTPLIEKQILLMLDDCLPFFSHLTMEHIFPQLHRITINRNVLGSNKRIWDIAHLKYPPPDRVTKYGRCNLPKQSAFYGAMFDMTCINELRPKVGDLVTHSVWRIKYDNEGLVYCPIFKNQPPKSKGVVNPRSMEYNDIYIKELKKFPENIQAQIDSLVQFIADSFTKDIRPDRHLDYIFSAYFSNKILYQFENGAIDAIYYPSVKDGLTFENIAIKPEVFDKKYYLAEVKENFVVQDLSSGKGGHFSHGISDCKTFDYAAGKILWDKDRMYQPDDFMRQIRMYHGVDIS
ncbi:MAG: hypothetical protein K1X81_11835 [Bacteroidia bacterium]|nr:hypothetical protein [Bacteroidia bacterium]